MAVERGFSGGDFARAEGVLRITARCVMAELSSGERWLLVWGSEQVSWDAAAEEIVFENEIPRRETERVRDGDAVELGGSGEFFSDAGDGPESVLWDEWHARHDWVAEPDPECPATGYWSVGAIAPLDQ